MVLSEYSNKKEKIPLTQLWVWLSFRYLTKQVPIPLFQLHQTNLLVLTKKHSW
jgi:hypothetical protein